MAYTLTISSTYDESIKLQNVEGTELKVVKHRKVIQYMYRSTSWTLDNFRVLDT